MNENEMFENMSSDEQIKKLREIMQQVKLLNRTEVISGQLEIEDVSFKRLPNGEVAYEVLINNPDGSKSLQYYSEKDNMLSKLDVNQLQSNVQMLSGEVSKYQSSGMEIAELNNSLIQNEQVLDALQFPDKISLVTLENVRQELMDFAIRCGINPDEIEAMISLSGNTELQLAKMSPEELQKFEQTAFELGIDKSEAIEYAKVDESGIALDERAVNPSNEGSIVGNDKVTTNYTFNQLIGLNYDTYRIIKNNSNEPVVIGITKDGRAEKIPDGILEANSKETKSMSLIKDDGTIRNVGVVASFRVRAPGSSLGRDQAIGIYTENAYTSTFYARNAGGDMMIGEELPSRVHTSQRIHSENLLDTKYNQDMRSEGNSAQNRTEDGCLDNVRNLGDGESNSMIYQEDSEQLIQKYADKYDIPPDILRDKYNYEIKNGHIKNKSDEEIIKEQAEFIDREERHEPDLPGERTHTFHP